MTFHSQHRCDRCGARLAQDNDSRRCASCDVRLRHRLPTPPAVPAEFWDATDAMRGALADRHMGRVIRAYRTHPYHGRHSLPQATAAAWFGITQPQLSRIETGPRIDHLDQLIHWARILRVPARHLWFTLPDDHEAAADTASGNVKAEHGNLTGSPGSLNDLGPNSASRTRTLLKAVRATPGPSLHYVPPVGATSRVRAFLASSCRVYTVKGVPGCGKTRWAYHVTEELSASADFQLHSVDSWQIDSLDLAAEILRYASIARGDDPLLQLEHASALLCRPCLVIIDGLKSQQEMNHVGRQIDRVLRQVVAENLRLLLIVRTPPDVEVSTYPLLTASVFQPRATRPGASYWMSPWELSEARDVWNRSREPGIPAFSDLPLSIQRLARLPLYMQLLRTGGGTSPNDENISRLIGFCVRSILRASGPDVERAVRALEDLAQSQMTWLIPTGLTSDAPRAPLDPEGQAAAAPLAHTSATGQRVFGHDVIREYFLASRIANHVIERGRSAVTVAAFNDLAERASTSAAARGVFELVVHSLDASAPELLAFVALSPTVDVRTTLPLLLEVAANGLAFATDDLLRTCAQRCSEDDAVELARALLAMPAITKALGNTHAGWLTGLLREFGSLVWGDVARSIEQALDAESVGRLLAAANLRDTDEATFFARHFFLFSNGGDDLLSGSLADLVGHPDWRVRAALAEGLRDDRSSRNIGAQLIIDRLGRDADYKVRAAVAKVITRLPAAAAMRYLMASLADANWHVRGCALQAILSEGVDTALARATAEVVTSQASWRPCPAQAAPLTQRLLLLLGMRSAQGDATARQHALFALLRESRTGWTRLPVQVRQGLVAEGRDSGFWLVRREVEAIQEGGNRPQPSIVLGDPAARREAFRRLRDRRSVQVALDLRDLDHAVTVAKVAAAAGADLIEVGDPLIKTFGLAAIERIKRTLPHTSVVAEMMSADWGREQVELAATAGADVVLLIGPATAASVAAAVDAGRRFGVPILLDVPAGHVTKAWVGDMERAGVDGLAITTNIDLGVRGRHPLEKARAIRGWTRLPVAVSGGFDLCDRPIVDSADWDILIVGRSITEAVEPAVAAQQLVELVHGRLRERAR